MKTPIKGTGIAGLPLSELLAQATKGPFERHMQDLVCSVKHGMVADCERKEFARRPSPSQAEFEANAELITRLLNFVHFGGGEALSNVIELQSSTDYPHVKEDMMRNISGRALAILNGEAQPSDI